MYLYLFSLWIATLFSPVHTNTIVVATPVPPSRCNAVSSENSDDPFLVQPKNILLATEDGGNSWKDFTGNFPGTSTPSCFWITQKDWLIGAAEGLYNGNPGIPSTRWQQDAIIPRDVTFFANGKAGTYAVSHWTGIYQRQTESGLWSKVSDILKNKPFFTFVESSGGDLLGGGETGIYKSDDHGKSWYQVYENVGVNMINEYDGVLYACSWRGLLRSTDGGNHWDIALPGNTTVFRTHHFNSGIVAIVEGQQFQGVWSPNEVMISNDKGHNWKPMFASLPKELKNVYDLVQVGNTYFAATNTGIYKSNNNGVTWEKTVTIPQDRGVNFKLVVEGETLFVLQAPGC
ncbi:MAG TPA: hypothetical protein VFV79_00845 [Saprospiraceae bacterium]|nr:hypothetical protein [Saprospiraceae bacterium]